ncbi:MULTISPECIES: hypothetical protein [unclassified Neisseria]|uniref:hypothetical protein n=1 Tax=unclassified Neisseria TaxID=2623750 RepID=UPI002666EF26|nr:MULTISPECIES: hypothetical protein [unclassified Neisseria]MDO1509403.1 hypothetical protein [Neisseria sp. MVDL19-042950]MDO1515824.1 hypothetical protein [Neisseria sp. MVDL18-041461]MDO1563352.1 hypothetical protein [Neisseria sp. MVDL20-010259]
MDKSTDSLNIPARQIPEYVFRENSRQMLERLSAELAIGKTLLWFSMYPPMLSAAVLRGVNLFFVVCWILDALFWFDVLALPRDTVWPFLDRILFASVFWFFYVGLSINPKRCICLDVQEKTAAYYTKGRLDESWQLDGQYGLWCDMGAVHLTHAQQGEKGELFVCDGFISQKKMVSLVKNLCSRLGLRLVYVQPVPTKSNHAVGMMVLGLAVAVCALTVYGFQYAMNRQTLRYGLNIKEISQSDARLRSVFQCNKSGCAHFLRWYLPEGGTVPVSCNGLEDTLCSESMRNVELTQVDLTLVRFQRREYRVVRAQYVLPLGGGKLYVDNRQNVLQEAAVFEQTLRKHMQPALWVAAGGMLLALFSWVYGRLKKKK